MSSVNCQALTYCANFRLLLLSNFVNFGWQRSGVFISDANSLGTSLVLWNRFEFSNEKFVLFPRGTERQRKDDI